MAIPERLGDCPRCSGRGYLHPRSRWPDNGICYLCWGTGHNPHPGRKGSGPATQGESGRIIGGSEMGQMGKTIMGSAMSLVFAGRSALKRLQGDHEGSRDELRAAKAFAILSLPVRDNVKEDLINKLK